MDIYQGRGRPLGPTYLMYACSASWRIRVWIEQSTMVRSRVGQLGVKAVDELTKCVLLFLGQGSPKADSCMEEKHSTL